MCKIIKKMATCVQIAIIIVNRSLEVILCHDADAVSALMHIVHVLTRAVEVLKSYSEVRRDVAEGVTEDILTALVLIVRECAIITLQVNI